MVILFPKGKLEELLASSEETNADLTKKYLEALIKTKSPKNLKETLLRKFARLGNEEEVKKVIEIVKKENSHVALQVEYEFLKRKYFSAKSGKEKFRKELKRVLKELIILEKNPNELKKWFSESVRMGFPDLAYLSAKKLATLTRSPEWYENAFLYAVYSGRYEEAGKFVGKFKPTKEETYIPLYYYFVEKHRYRDALKIIKEYISKYPKDREKVKEELIIAYILNGQIDRAKEVLNEFARDKENKRKLVFTAIKKLIEVGAYEEAKRMIWKYLPLFKGDIKLLTGILRFSLQTGDAKFAARVAEEILRWE